MYFLIKRMFTMAIPIRSINTLSTFLLCIVASTVEAATAVPAGNWYGDDVYVGYAYDLHANKDDTEIGARMSVDYLVDQLSHVGADLLQTDSKGHEGVVSWYSETPGATVAPGIVQEIMPFWVAAGNELGIPVQAHYSGIFDEAAGKKFPEWTAVDANGERVVDKMCPRSEYVDKLLIPQAKELIDRYGISGFWVDGEIWAVVPCYCEDCASAYTEQSGLQPPTAQDAENWTDWIAFTRQSFYDYIGHYVDEIHKHNPEIRVCSNWLHSFRNPGRPSVHTDFLSGDNIGTITHPNTDCHARFFSTRQRHWEIMVWAFYYNEHAPWVLKPLSMIKEHMASTIALGGSINLYNQPKGHRDGRIPEHHVDRISQAVEFARERQAMSKDSVTVPNAVILHSEYDFYAQASPNIWEYPTQHIEGALAALLDGSIPTDIMDEWALLQELERFPLVIAPSQENMSSEAATALEAYVRNGGHLLLTGTGAFDVFDSDFLGIKNGGVTDKHPYHIPANGEPFPLSTYGHQGGAWTEVSVFPWQEFELVTAEGFGPVTTSLMKEDGNGLYGASIHRVGKGAVAYIPFDIATYYYNSRYSFVRDFFHEVIDELNPSMPIQIQAPVAVEPILRQKDGNQYLHLINRASGLPIFKNVLGGDDHMPSGPIAVTIPLDQPPKNVRLLFESGALDWSYRPKSENASGTLSILIPSVLHHLAIEIQLHTNK